MVRTSNSSEFILVHWRSHCWPVPQMSSTLHVTVTSNELGGSWKHPHTFSNLSLQNTALFAVGPCGIQNKHLFFSARIFKLKKRTFKLYLQSHFTDSRPVSGRDKSELAKSGTCEFFSCTVFHKEKPPKCCFGCPVEPYFMNCQRLRAKDKLFLHEWVLLKYFKRKLNIPVTVTKQCQFLLSKTQSFTAP